MKITDTYHERSPGVSHLLGRSCPLAIFWAVSFLIVFSFNAQSFGNLSHVREERIEITPAFTHGYSSSSVIWKASTFRVRASVMHVLPCMVCFARDSNCPTMPVISLSGFIGRKTPTGFCVSGSQKRTVHDNGCSTFAGAMGHSAPFSICSIAFYFKPSKDLSFDQSFSNHNISINVVFSSGRPAVTGAHCDIVSQQPMEDKT